MAQVGLFTIGQSPLGSGAPDKPEGTGYANTGSYTLGAGVGSGGAGSGSGSGGLVRSGVVNHFMSDALTGAPVYMSMPISEGSIVEDIDSIPYGQGSVVSDGMPQTQYLLLSSGVSGFAGTELQLTTKTRLGLAGATTEYSANMGRFLVESVERRADPDRFGATFRLVSKALSNLGGNVSGDLPTQAFGFASSLGLVAGGRASIEGIIAWLIDRAGNYVQLSDGFLSAHAPTQAYQLLTNGAYIGPYSIQTQSAASVLRRAIEEAGVYLRCRTDGGVVITPWPDGQHTPPSMTVVRSYGYGDHDHPFAWLRPAPIAKPSSVSVIQQSVLVATRTVTVAVGGGYGTGVPKYFNHFLPTSADSFDHQSYRANQYAATFVMKGEQVEIGVIEDGVVHAGDCVRIDGSSHGITPGVFLVKRATHPTAPGQYVGSLMCQRLAYVF